MVTSGSEDLNNGQSQERALPARVRNAIRAFHEDQQGATTTIETVLIIFIAAVIIVAIFAFYGDTIAPGFMNQVNAVLNKKSS
jgi:Flp pilus assembly pilin Flp